MKISKFGSRPFFYDIQPRLFRAEHRKPDKIRSMDCFLFCQFMIVWYNKPPDVSLNGNVTWMKGRQINRPNENEIRKWLEEIL